MLSRLLLLRPSVKSISKNSNVPHRNTLKFLNRTKSSAVGAQDVGAVVKESVWPIQHVIQHHERKFSEGKEYRGFQCTRVEHVPEFGLMSYSFKHNLTGTEFWYLDRKDQNNVFSINFRTTPFDSTGLPHILEHSVLCGSQKYPVRDPFFKMLNRSVATFMNAMTGPDYTIYPFSSMNEIDFRNLQGIYLDAVFRPKLEYLDFLQEGWRLEHTDLHNKESEYIIKGVVYNEMKGAFSENSSVFGQNLLNNLLPNHTYGYVSGGNPLEIPKLSHANLVDFHSKYYHPSNARIYAYGTFDANKTMEIINDEYLSGYRRIDNSYSDIPNQPRWEKPRNVHISSRYDNMGAAFEKQNQIAIALLMCDITNTQESFTMHVLTELLVRGPNSPFYKNLIEPNFSGGYNQTTGYDPQAKDTFFCVGLQDLRVDDFPRVQEIFDSTIQNVMENGFDDKHVESVLHNIELSLKHQSPQFGLGLLFNSAPLWNHDGDVVRSLHVSNMISVFRENVRFDPKFLQKKVERYFAHNPHRLTLTMSPDDHYEDNFKTAELQLLKEKIISLDHEKRQEIYENGLKLEEVQKTPPDLNVLPCLSIKDVKEPRKFYPINVVKIGGVPTQVCTLHTNEISYVKCHYDASPLTRDEIMLIPIFCEVIGDMGTMNYDYREFDKLVLTKTGGIDFKLHFEENIFHSKTFNVGVLMGAHCLDKNIGDMFDLFLELSQFRIDDTERLQMLIDNYMSSMPVGIVNNGHTYAMLSASSMVTDAAKLKAQLVGVEHIDYMKQYVRNHDISMLMESLKSIGRKIFNRNSLRVAINTSDEFYPKAVEKYSDFLQKLPPGPSMRRIDHKINVLTPGNLHYVMNIPVNYCSKALLTVPYTHRDHPVLRIFSKLISAKYLLPVVREQNGAYGAGARIGYDGIFNFFSYRDPNSSQTLNAFDNAYRWLLENSKEIDDHVLFEAKLGVLQQLDAPVAAGNEGLDFFLYGISQDMLVKYRARMLSVTLNELKSVAAKYFKEDPAHIGTCILGPENKILEEETKMKWKVIR